MSGSLAHRLYTGSVKVDFVGKRKIWFLASGAAVLLSIISLLTLGLHTSIEFRGGVAYVVPANGHTEAELKQVVADTSGAKQIVTTTQRDTKGGVYIRLETESVGTDKVTATEKALETKVGAVSQNGNAAVDVSEVGPSWGSDISNKAIQGLIVFLVFVSAYLAIRYEWKMAAAAIVALIHDLIIAAGVYSLSRFEVSPATVIASLTILGFSLYDTVVVFDKVRENTRNLTSSNKYTFSGAANLAVNQTLMRSINTSIIGLLPVAGLLIIGAGLLGAGSLKDLSLPLLIGLAAGTYSSIFIAVPLLCDFKEREPGMKALAKRVAAGPRIAQPTMAGAVSTAPGSGATVVRSGNAPGRPVTTGRRRPTGPRPKRK
ncbi:MAG: preprotein translocase subunit SecF [Frankiaceae bacterium]|jgi:preprotein translocase subunit SecF|nr:preprotein translocase subunit SecF [Frankiaceae bacterium]